MTNERRRQEHLEASSMPSRFCLTAYYRFGSVNLQERPYRAHRQPGEAERIRARAPGSEERVVALGRDHKSQPMAKPGRASQHFSLCRSGL